MEAHRKGKKNKWNNKMHILASSSYEIVENLNKCLKN